MKKNTDRNFKEDLRKGRNKCIGCGQLTGCTGMVEGHRQWECYLCYLERSGQKNS